MTGDIFKIEAKPGWYVVSCYIGSYSDAEEKHEFIRANDPDEAWELYKRYLKITYKENAWSNQYSYNGERFCMDNEGFEDWSVVIEPLKVITFKSVKRVK